jgi:hypothetical protein
LRAGLVHPKFCREATFTALLKQTDFTCCSALLIGS